MNKDFSKISVAMTIAGSDSGGGAGIQTDLRTFFHFGVYGTSAITAITAQNPNEVTAVLGISPEIVAAQISTVLKEINVKSIKTGMLFSAEIIKKVAEELLQNPAIKLVIDPVMISTSGAKLINDDAVDVLKNKLFPLATLITPNLAETEILSGIKINGLSNILSAGKFLSKEFSTHFLIKGGHSLEKEATDYLFFNGEKIADFSTQRLENYLSNHGSGCTLSAAIAANLAKNINLEESIMLAKNYVFEAIKNGVEIGENCYGMWNK